MKPIVVPRLPHELVPALEADEVLDALSARDTTPRVGRCPRLPPLPLAWRIREAERFDPHGERLLPAPPPAPRVAVPPHAGGCWVSAINHSEINQGRGLSACGIFASSGYALAVCPRCRAQYEAERAAEERQRRRARSGGGGRS